MASFDAEIVARARSHTLRKLREAGHMECSGDILIPAPRGNLRRIGPYELVGELPSGSMGTSFVSVHQSTSGRPILGALTCVHPEHASNSRFRKILFAESVEASRFRHAGSVRTFDVADHGGDLIIVSQLVDGESLGALSSRLAAAGRSLSVELVAWMGVQIVRAFQAAHATPWIHGESKGMFRGGLAPHDVMLGFSGTVMVRGLGLGRSRVCLPPSRAELAYRAPELFAQHKADHLVDVYSIGVVLADALRGRRCFHHDTVSATKNAVLMEPMPSLTGLRDDVPDEVDDLLQRMAAKMCTDRPSRLEEIARVLAAQLTRNHDAYASELSELMGFVFPAEVASAKRRRAQYGGAASTGMTVPGSITEELIDAIVASAGNGKSNGNHRPSLGALDGSSESFEVDRVVDMIVAGAAREASGVHGPPDLLDDANGSDPGGGLAKRFQDDELPEVTPPFVETTPDLIEDPNVVLAPGEIVGERYRIICMIGEGGVSVVYRAQHTLLLKDVALKVLRPELTNHRTAVDRFQREARSVCQLDDPHIVRVTDFGRTDRGALFLVMELVDGHPLSHRIRSRDPIEPEVAVRIACEILRGLEHAHGAGIVHRDLKPENIMLVEKQGRLRAKILDFGIAQLGEGGERGQSLTRSGTVCGTPRYMAPEQAAGEPMDRRTDIYGVGVILFEMLTGAPPFNGASTVQILSRVLTQEPPPIMLPTLPEALAEQLRSIVGSALAKEREERPPTARQMRMALERWVAQVSDVEEERL